MSRQSGSMRLALGGVIVSLLLLLFACKVEAADKAMPAVQTPKWSPWIEYGGYYSNERSRGEMAMFVPLWQSNVGLLFTDLRGKLFEDNIREGNFALGYRHMLAGGWNAGIWGGYDVRRSTTGNTFHQLSGGLELLSDDFDLRFNAYTPLTDPKQTPSLAEIAINGSQIEMVGGREVPLWGFDGELGVRVPLLRDFDLGRLHQELRLYAGGFYFDARDALQAVAGPKARAEWRFTNILPSASGSRLTLEAEWRNDDVRGSVWEVGARLRIPFGGDDKRMARLTAQERRMLEGLERDTDIVTGKSASELVSDASTGVAFDRVAFVDSGGSVTTTSTNAGANSLIVARGGTISGAQTLPGNLTLLGGGGTIQVRGRDSGTIVSFTAPGSTPTLAAPGTSDSLTLSGSNTHVAGLAIQGSGAGGNDGVSFGSGLSNMLISSTQITGVGGAGILFGSNNVVTVVDTTITNAGVFGINFVSNNTVRISGTTINGGATVTDDAIEFNGGNTVAINNSRITGSFQNDGIDMNAAGNILSGSGNTATGATYGTGFCSVTGAQTGQLTFDTGTCP